MPLGKTTLIYSLSFRSILPIVLNMYFILVVQMVRNGSRNTRDAKLVPYMRALVLGRGRNHEWPRGRRRVQGNVIAKRRAKEASPKPEVVYDKNNYHTEGLGPT